MPELSFTVVGAEAPAHLAAPHLVLKLGVASPGASVRALLLQAQVRIDATRRAYEGPTAERLGDLFGPPARWGETVRSLLWANVTHSVPGFEGETIVELTVPCTFDFNVGATRYFDALQDGVVPLVLYFSGTVFHDDPEGALRVAQVAREAEATFALPVALWKDMMARHYPDTTFVPLRRDLFDRLLRYRSRASAPTWERALEDLLAQAGEPG